MFFFFFQQANAVTETDQQKMKERLQEVQLELQEYKIKYEKALQVSALCTGFVSHVGLYHHLIYFYFAGEGRA